ncbi:MAG TPA: nitrite/sulfite reductase [Bryobacteraceae bacterium]|nr:nitrite/sulfite reductase [Bryobacteraceae bacterium]
MKVSNPLWKDKLAADIAPQLARELEIYDNEVTLKKNGKIDDKVFAETRLRRGAYGQRYDNGQRHDGVETKRIPFPSTNTKSPGGVLWDAPGMQRIKIPFGGLNAIQLEVLAELAEEYSDSIAHVTTRQDFQLHYIHIEDTPAIMRRLAAVGITTREACGNTVRNVTACPIAGVCRTQSFDVTPYAKATAMFLLGHPLTQDFGRKFKIAFSGCKDEACGLVALHDIGAIGLVKDGRRGFEFYVGGGLGTVPQQAKLFSEFVGEDELLPLSLAICRVFAKYGEKKNRNTARLKFLINKIGLDEFKRRVAEERAALEPDSRWTEYLQHLDKTDEQPLRKAEFLQITPAVDAEFQKWYDSNVYGQRQAGYATVTICLPLGDITSDQLRALADIARKYTRETLRLTVEQNIVLRWVSEADLPALYSELKAASLEAAGAGSIVDVVSCPGTDTCKLGISSSRGLAAELRTRLLARGAEVDETIRGLHIKISGCFNSCGQHHICDLGFYGMSRVKNGYAVPHFQVVLGGEWEHNAGSYGLAVGAVPSKRIPDVVDRFTERYVAERGEGETFGAFIKRIGKAECKKMVEDMMVVPPHEASPEFYKDWGDAREYGVGDLGEGECAGEVVTPTEFQLTAAEREAFEAQLQLERGEVAAAASTAYGAMSHGALALLKHRGVGFPEDAESVMERFRKHLFDTNLFHDDFVGGKFAQYYFDAHDGRSRDFNSEEAHRLVEETQVFLEACYACYARMLQQPAVAAV